MPTTTGDAKDKKKSSAKKSSKKDSTNRKDRDKKKRSSSSNKSKRSKSPKKTPRKRGESDDNRDAMGDQAPPSLPAAAVNPADAPPPPAEQDPKASSDFEAGLLFQRFARNGGVNANDFQRMWREASGGGLTPASKARLLRRASQMMGHEAVEGAGVGGDGIGPEKIFEFGQLFQHFDTDADGRLGRADFEKLIKGALKARQGADSVQPEDDGERNRKKEGAEAATGQEETKGAEAGETATLVALPPSMTHYDETTGVPLIREAVASQVSLGHTVVLLNEAYSRRLSRLQTLSSSRLMPVREQLLQLRRRLHNRADEVKAAKAAIERESFADASAIVERLRSVEALKQASLTQGVNDVTAELEGVDKIAQQVTDVTALSAGGRLAASQQGYGLKHDLEGTNKMVELIQAYPELCDCIERVANKSFDPDIDIRADDFPHEIAERLEVLRRADQYEKALSVKDQMLWDTLQESQNLEEQCQEQARLRDEYSEEAQEWVALAGKLSNDLQALRQERSVMTPNLRKANERLVRENKELRKRLGELDGERRHNEGSTNA